MANEQQQVVSSGSDDFLNDLSINSGGNLTDALKDGLVETGDGGNEGGDEGGQAQVTQEEQRQQYIEKITNTPEDQLSDDEKNDLAEYKKQQDNGEGGDDNGNGDGEEEVVELTDEQIAEIKAKKPEELTDDEKEILSQLENEESEDDIINIIKDAVNIDALKDKTFDNTQEGLTNLISEVRKVGGQEELKNMLSEKPLMAQLYEHYEQGKSDASFFQRNSTPDYKQFDLESEEGQKALLTHSLSKRGVDKEIIDITLEKYENDGNLKEKAEADFKLLDDSEKERLQAIEQAEIEYNRKVQEQQKEIDLEINKVLKSKKILGVSLDDQETKNFQRYLIEQVELEGGQKIKRSEADYNKLSVEEQLFFNYLLFKELKVKGIEGKKIKDQQLGKLNSGSKKIVYRKKQQSQSKSDQTLNLKGKSLNSDFFQN